VYHNVSSPISAYADRRETRLDNAVTTIAKVAALAGGAVIGALLARWCDELLSTHLQEKSEYDKTRYAQGLAPLAPPYAKGQDFNPMNGIDLQE
jgi:hypothetical protein